MITKLAAGNSTMCCESRPRLWEATVFIVCIRSASPEADFRGKASNNIALRACLEESRDWDVGNGETYDGGKVVSCLGVVDHRVTCTPPRSLSVSTSQTQLLIFPKSYRELRRLNTRRERCEVHMLKEQHMALSTPANLVVLDIKNWCLACDDKFMIALST